jgi:hypothetical protein
MRRKLVIYTLMYCAFFVGFIAFDGADTRINETLVLALTGLAGASLGVYMGVAAYQDTTMAKITKPRKDKDNDKDEDKGP